MTGMRTLYILRHAEAEAGTPDWRRSLTKAGKTAAASLGRIMRERGFRPDVILCSEARRTRETLTALALADTATPAFRKDIYSATPGDLLAVVQAIDATAPSALIVGHNPAVHELARYLTGTGDETMVRTLSMTYPPGTLTVLQSVEAWADWGPGCAHLIDSVQG